MNWYTRAIESERYGESPYRKNYSNFYDGPMRKILYSDNISSIIKRMDKNYSIKKETKASGFEYRIIVNDLLTIDYIVDCRESVIYGDGSIEEQVVILRLIAVKEGERGKGFGTKFMNDLQKTTQELYPHLCYVLFPYLDIENESQNLKIGRWYMGKLGFRPLRAYLGFEHKPHIRMSIEDLYNKGIRPLGWAVDWETYGGLGPFVAKEEEYTPVQKRYFHESKPL
jgi:hypothetical protein